MLGGNEESDGTGSSEVIEWRWRERGMFEFIAYVTTPARRSWVDVLREDRSFIPERVRAAP
jgi:hypothetical protein